MEIPKRGKVVIVNDSNEWVYTTEKDSTLDEAMESFKEEYKGTSGAYWEGDNYTAFMTIAEKEFPRIRKPTEE